MERKAEPGGEVWRRLSRQEFRRCIGGHRVAHVQPFRFRLRDLLRRRARLFLGLGFGGAAVFVAAVVVSDLLWRSGWTTVAAVLIQAAVAVMFLSLVLLCLTAGANAERGLLPPRLPQQAVQCDQDAIHIGELMMHSIRWWEVDSVEQGEVEWRVHWRRGSFSFDARDRRHRGLKRMLLKVLCLREQGYLLPGEPDPVDLSVPEGAISPVRMEGADDSAERGISRIDD